LSSVVTGYASLDYALRLDRPPEADRTATILSRAEEFPRLGGSPAYAAAAMAAAGAPDVAPVTWVGDDAQGARYRDDIAALGVSTEGVGVRAGRTPVCVLAYEPGGGCHCFYHPSLREPLTLDARQRALVAGAELVCVTVGPQHATREVLALLLPDARLVWAVKADPRAVPPDLAAALASRADIVVSSRGEAAFVAAAFAGATARKGRRIETRGGEGVAIVGAEGESLVPAEPVAAGDTTGAGDTFLGGFLAAWRGGELRPAVQQGVAAARSLLERRAERERTIHAG
jgi:ribokinase